MRKRGEGQGGEGCGLTVGATELSYSIHKSFVQLRSPAQPRLGIRRRDQAIASEGVGVQTLPLLLRREGAPVWNQASVGVLLHLVHCRLGRHAGCAAIEPTAGRAPCSGGWVGYSSEVSPLFPCSGCYVVTGRGDSSLN